MTRILIGIDDTDNMDSRGTGFHSRQLGKLIEKNELGIVTGITRHQLFFDSRIPYTSQNSSACLEVQSDQVENITNLSREFLLNESADGSDAGLAISMFNNISDDIINWGLRAKKEILIQNEANSVAKKNNILLEGLTGNKDGIIGSMAAIGLRKSGNDGRFIWIRGRELRNLKGVFSVGELLKDIEVDSIIDRNGNPIPNYDRIDVGEWLRPVLKNREIIILADKSIKSNCYEWKVSPKAHIKRVSD